MEERNMAKKKTAVITLEGEQYTVHALNVGQIERFMDELDGSKPRGKIAMTMLRMAMERAEPKVENFDDLEPTLPEITAAGEIIAELSGLQKPDANPPPQLKIVE